MSFDDLTCGCDATDGSVDDEVSIGIVVDEATCVREGDDIAIGGGGNDETHGGIGDDSASV